MKKCHKCKEELPEECFSKNKSKADGLGTECKVCRKKYMDTYYIQNHSVINNQNKKRGKMRHKDARRKVLEHYSNGTMKCACPGCNEDKEEFLTINHINGGGNKDRKTFKGARTFYEYLVKNNYPPDLNVLCYNCNCSKGFFGYCPHERVKG